MVVKKFTGDCFSSSKPPPCLLFNRLAVGYTAARARSAAVLLLRVNVVLLNAVAVKL